MKKMFLMLLVAYALIVPQSQATEVNGKNACEMQMSKLNDTIPTDGVYVMPSRPGRGDFIITIKNKEVISLFDKETETELISKVRDMKFFLFSEKGGEDANEYSGENYKKGYLFHEISVINKIGEDEYLFYAVLLGDMKKCWCEDTSIE